MTTPIKVTAPAAIVVRNNMQGEPKRRLFLTVHDLETLPQELFALKTSESTNPERTGKPAFKYLVFRDTAGVSSSMVPPQAGLTVADPLDKVKATVIQGLGAAAKAGNVSVAVNMPGKFGNIRAPRNGEMKNLTIFDLEAYPDTKPYPGFPGYYFISGTEVTATLTPAVSHNRAYFQVALESNVEADKIFREAGRAEVWTPGGSTVSGSDDNASW